MDRCLLVTAIVLVPLAACSREPVLVHAAPEPAAATEAAEPPVVAAPVEPLLAEPEPAGWQRALIARQSEEIDRLRGRIRELEAELAESRAATMSRRVEDLRAAPVLGEPAPQAAPRRERPIVSAYSAPQATPMGDVVLVSGRLFNSGPGDADVELTLDLLEDGQVVDSTSLLIPVAARTNATYSHTFRHQARNGRIYAARASLRY